MSLEIITLNIDYIISCYRNGNSVKSIAKKYGVTHKVIRKRLTDNGISINSKFSNIVLPYQEIVKLYQKGKSVKALAKQFNVSRNVIYRYLSESNIPTRNRSESMYIRMAQTPLVERQRLVKKAHDAIRGRVVDIKEGVMRANAREKTLQYVGKWEADFVNELRKNNISVIPQKAIHIYNIDIFTPPSICMEIACFKTNPFFRKQFRTRCIYLLNSGFNIIIVWINKGPPDIASCTDYLISKIQSIQWNPAIRSQYWVIRGSGKFVARGSCDSNHLTFIEPSENPFCFNSSY